MSLDDLTRLAEWDTPALSNALDALRLRSFNTGYTDGIDHDSRILQLSRHHQHTAGSARARMDLEAGPNPDYS